MGTIEDIKKMQGEGKSEQEIRDVLRQRGASGKEIDEGFAQARIKEAVGSDGSENYSGSGSTGVGSATMASRLEGGLQDSRNVESFSGGNAGEIVGGPLTQESQRRFGGDVQAAGGTSEMQPSMMGFEGGSGVDASQPSAQYPAYGYSGDYGNYGDSSSGYGEYQPYQGAISSDVVGEIADQVISEKLAPLRERFEKIINFKTTSEAKLASLDERLKRIEKIIDSLQLSILHRVGEYVTDVKDIKRELEETQKSFKTLVHHKSHRKKHP